MILAVSRLHYVLSRRSVRLARMGIVRVDLTRFIQDSQEYGSNDEHMVSRVFFNLSLDGQPKGSFHSDVKLVVGGSFETDALEVAWPAGYSQSDPFDYNRFVEGVTNYIRSLVGTSGRGIRLGPGSQNIRMTNCSFVMPASFSFQAPDATVS